MLVAAGCSDRTLTVPLIAEDESLVLLRAGDPFALACDVESGCPAIELGHDDWEVLVLVYDQTTVALGLPAGAIALEDPASGVGARFPATERAFSATSEDPRLQPQTLGAARLYAESRYDPDPGCPSWREAWSSRPGNADRADGFLAVDARTVLVFADNGEVVRVRDTGQPEVVRAGPVLHRVTEAGDGVGYGFGVDRGIHRISDSGEATLLDAIPPLPQPQSETQPWSPHLAGDGPDDLFVLLVSGEGPTRTSTVWHFDGVAWAVPSRDGAGAAYRTEQDAVSEVLMRGVRGQVFTSELPEAPLVRVTATGERIPVPELADVHQVMQLRRLTDGRVLISSRIARQGRVHIGALDAAGALVVEHTYDLPDSPNWICAEAARGGVYCSASDGFTTFLDGPADCASAHPPTFKGQRWMLRLGEGWLVKSYDAGGVESLHRVDLE